MLLVYGRVETNAVHPLSIRWRLTYIYMFVMSVKQCIGSHISVRLSSRFNQQRLSVLVTGPKTKGAFTEGFRLLA